MKARRDMSKARKTWAPVKAAAEQRLAGLGGVLDWSPHDHEVMRWLHPSLMLIFYPHRTTCGNYHVRVRKGSCTDRELLRTAILALAENGRHFQFPTEPELHREGVAAALEAGRETTP